jgi:hypothetical protein
MEKATVAATPSLEIFSAEGEYVASVKYFDDAACLISFYGDGAQVRSGHGKKEILWTEGSESFPAGDNYNGAVDIMASRLPNMEKAKMQMQNRKLEFIEPEPGKWFYILENSRGWHESASCYGPFASLEAAEEHQYDFSYISTPRATITAQDTFMPNETISILIKTATLDRAT